MPPGNCIDGTTNCSGLHGPCGVGEVLITTSLAPLVYITRYCLRYVLNWADISPTGPGMTGVAAPGLAGTQAFWSEFQYSYLLRSGTAPGSTRATYAEPPRRDGVPNE